MWGAGPVGKMFARELLSSGVEVAEFVEVDPRKIGKMIYDIPVRSAAEASALRPGSPSVLWLEP